MKHALLMIAFVACGGSAGDRGDAGGTGTSSGDAGGNRDGGGTGGGDGGGTGSGTVAGCAGAGATFLANPADPTARGPWPVGVKTATIGARELTVELWYPAVPGSDSGKAHARYDIRDQLPASERSKISDTDNPWQDCDCVRDLPIDDAHGPYPIVVFVHGTAAFRHQSLPIVTHWASRGFVVVAADHPGLRLGDFLAMFCNQPSSGGQDLAGDLDQELAAVSAPQGELAFLAGHVDTSRVAIAGHSAGANAAANASSKASVVIAMAGNQKTGASSSLASTLYLGGESDGVVSWGSVKTAWNGSPTPRRLVELASAGHLAFSDLCQIHNAAGDDILHVAQEDDVCGAQLAGFLFDCKSTYLDGPTGWDITDYASSTVLESTLQCAQGLPDLAQIQQVFADVKSYAQML